MWTRRRVTQASEIKYFRSPVTEALKTGEVTWDDIAQYEASVPAQVETFISTQTKLAEKLSAVCDKIGEHHYWTSTTEGKEIQLQLMKMKQEIHTLACSVRDTVLGQDIRKPSIKLQVCSTRLISLKKSRSRQRYFAWSTARSTEQLSGLFI